jgi:hypothetical protein
MFPAGVGRSSMGSVFRLSPGMVSRKTQVLRFIKEYFREWGRSPSLGEIGGGLGISKKRVHELLGSLERDGEISRIKGQANGIILPVPAEMISREDFLRQAKEAGFTIVQEVPGGSFVANNLGLPLTLSGLPLLPELNDIPDVGVGELEHDKSGGGSPL